MKTALFHVSTVRRRIYRPDEAPDEAQAKACDREAQGIEAEHVSESVFGTCKETGLRGNEHGRGIALETSGRDAPTWRIYDKGEGAGLVGSVVDVDRFLAFLAEQGELSAAQVRRLRYVERDGGISLRFHKRRGYGEGTVAESDFGRVDWPSPAIDEAQETLAAAWETYVRALERRAVVALRAEYDYLSAWSTIAERLADFGEGIDDEGRSWPLADCEEGPDDEADEGEE